MGERCDTELELGKPGWLGAASLAWVGRRNGREGFAAAWLRGKDLAWAANMLVNPDQEIPQ
jgi:hypothetical protein